MSDNNKIDHTEAIQRICVQGAALGNVIGAAKMGTLEDTTLSNIGWLVSDLFEEIGRIAGEVAR